MHVSLEGRGDSRRFHDAKMFTCEIFNKSRAQLSIQMTVKKQSENNRETRSTLIVQLKSVRSLQICLNSENRLEKLTFYKI